MCRLAAKFLAVLEEVFPAGEAQLLEHDQVLGSTHQHEVSLGDAVGSPYLLGYRDLSLPCNLRKGEFFHDLSLDTAVLPEQKNLDDASDQCL